MSRFQKFILLLCLVPSLVFADDASNSFLRFIKRIISRGLSSYRSTTIAFNGQPYYSIPLTSINARGILSWSLSLNYYGGIQND